MTPRTPLWKKLCLLTNDDTVVPDEFVSALPPDLYPSRCPCCRYQLVNMVRQLCPECGLGVNEFELRRQQHAGSERKVARLLREQFGRREDLLILILRYFRAAMAAIVVLLVLATYAQLFYLRRVLGRWRANPNANVVDLEAWLDFFFGYQFLSAICPVLLIISNWLYTALRRHWIEKQLSTFDAAPSSHKPQASSPP